MALVVDGDGKVGQRRLTLDRALGDQWLVTAGVAAGERVIVDGIQNARPGASVKAVPFEAGRKEEPPSRKTAPPAAKSN